MKVLSESQLKASLAQLQNWKASKNYITKTIIKKDFKETFSLMTAIALEAEAMNHHPNWSNAYNKIIIKLTTHDAGGITQKDIELAKAIDKLSAE